MSCLPKLEPHVKTPLDKSCNCCDGSSFSIFCCTSRPKSPAPPKDQDQKTQEIVTPIFHKDPDNKPKESNNV